MRYFRSLLAMFCFFLFGVGGFIIGTFIFPIIVLVVPKKKQSYILSDIIQYSWKFFIWVMSALYLIKVEISGEDKLKRLFGAVVVANHPTLIDIVILISIVPHAVCVVKSKLAENFFIKSIIKKIYLINSDSPEEFLIKAKKMLQEGMNVIIFPEGTRTREGQEIHLHRGFAHLALQAKANVVPIKINAFPKILGKEQFWCDVSNHRSIYQIKVYDALKIVSSKDVSPHISAKKISNSVQKLIFEIKYFTK